jgi:hypothetical protein
MPANYKVLGQVAPSATTETSLYTVPAATQAVISTLVICNRANVSATYRVAVRPAGEALADKHYVVYDVSVAGGDSTTLTIGITLNETDVISVYASTANFSFSVFGSEITE